MSDSNYPYQKIVQPLLCWYDVHARVLPWRDDPTPYRVWVSEIMLQQTRVEAVKPYFLRFMEALPSIEALAQAPEDQLMKLWEGLGYYSRARNLQKAAQMVVREYGGQLPASFEELQKLPGIGAYTAGAVASIAFGIPAVAVDGNVLRVTSRLSASREDISDAAVKQDVGDALLRILPKRRVGDFNQALMELGATVCLPNGVPLCDACPLRECCLAYEQDIAPSLPVKAAKKARRIEQKTVFVLLSQNRVALRRRESTGLLAGLWEFPNLPGHLSAQEAKEALQAWGIADSKPRPLPAAKHIFTHVEWQMHGFLAYADAPSDDFCWLTLPEIEDACALPSAFRAYTREMQKALTDL